MNDRFLYRAICNDGKFHHGYLARLYKDEGYGKKGDFCISNSSFCPYAYLVTRPETIGQCTGLKDKNGNLIYEGDICRISGTYYCCESDEELGVDTIEIVESLERFFAEAMIKSIYSALGCDTLKVEIIGNVHENPDLLKNPENVKGDNK